MICEPVDTADTSAEDANLPTISKSTAPYIACRKSASNIDFLYGTSDVMNCDYIVISRSESPELYSLVETLQQNHDIKDRILAYARELNRKEKRG